MRSIPVFPTERLGALAFEVLINREEVFNLKQKMTRHLLVAVNVTESRIACGVGQNLLVRHPLVQHFENANRTDGTNAAWKSSRIRQDQNVERVAILGKGLGDETVVSWIMNGRMEVSVQPEDMKLLVILIFAGALERNLDYGSDNFRNFVATAAQCP